MALAELHEMEQKQQSNVPLTAMWRKIVMLECIIARNIERFQKFVLYRIDVASRLHTLDCAVD